MGIGGEKFLTMGYCFPYCFLEMFGGEKENKALMEGGQSRGKGSPNPPTEENPAKRDFIKIIFY